MVAFGFLFALAAASSTLAHPIHHHQDRDLRIVGSSMSTIWKRQAVPGSEFSVLVDGNKAFKDSTDSALLKKLADEGQAPPFMFIGCSDSRVSEGTVFQAKPGTLFTERNIANQFQPTDPNAQAVLSYAVAELGVQHVIVMGHYGCGGIAAAIASPPASNVDAANGAVQAWIEPIREQLRTSTRTEIVELREKIKGRTDVEEPEISDPGFRALVEENVKAGVSRIAANSVIVNHYATLAGVKASERRDDHAPLGDVFIHGWVYDIENGEVRDLGISVGPPGKAIPAPPFAAVAKAAEKTTVSHEAPKAEPVQSVEARCQEQCKTKRSFLPRNH
ncbi:carbonic anhydrase [Ephemerocybe angulata]|uniref:Carbonic anhydrase n=1 Tax=Ephemerocybe angulata TaxID=980116 RepID=A0A8H6IFL1_9AGAR|nr:carbonic anhydrase [Tulosesus angulatus]